MRVRLLIALIAVSAMTVFDVALAYADDTGFVKLHELRRYSKYLCTVSHEHTGIGTIQKNKKLAIRSAARSWSEFTAWEYGSDWARWEYARGKTIMCEGEKEAISCSVVARPCKLVAR